MAPILQRFHHDQTPVSDVEGLIQRLPEKEWASPFRSTVPLLSLMRHDPTRLVGLLSEFGLSTDAALHVEFQVEPPLGTGKPSHTDLMAIAGDDVVAIESKWTEPRYESVSAWQALGSSPDNRTNVLTGWIGCLQRHSKKELNVDDFGDVVYQMVHRAASACATGKRPRLAYMVFRLENEPSELASYTADLGHFYDVLGRPSDFPFYAVEMTMAPTPAFAEIQDLKKGTPHTAARVREALVVAPLFEFKGVEIRSFASS